MPRASDGTVTLPVGNPVVAGTAISADVQNATIADLASMIEDSLSRSGDGGMTVPMEFAKGTNAAPSMTFVGDTNTGVNSDTEGEVDIVANGTAAMTVATTGVTIPGTLAVTGAATVTGNATVTGTLTVTGAIGIRRSDLPAAGQVLGAGASFGGAPLVISDFSSEANLPTATGRPIIITAQAGDNSSSNRFYLTAGAGNMNGSIYLYRKIGAGAYVAIARQYFTVLATQTINLALAPFIDTPGAGSITYKLCYVVSDATGNMANEGMVLAAYEL